MNVQLGGCVVAIASTVLCVGTMGQTTQPLEPVCPRENDLNSPRHTWLRSATPDPDEIIRKDIDGDGKPDVIETWWNGKRVRWLGEGGTMKWTDTRGSMSNDCLQIDRDGDGFYDGPGDINIKWVDEDNDGRPDMEIFSANPAPGATESHGGLSHYMIFIDDDHDGVLGCMNWQTFEFGQSNWEVAASPATAPWRPQPPPNFLPDYHGNATFMKQHDPPWVLTDPRFNGENPFLFYDTDGDGCTEMSIRLDDDSRHNAPGWTRQNPKYSYDGKITQAYISYDLDNNSGCGNEFDYDMTLRFASAPDGPPGECIDYSKFHDPHPKMKAPEWAIPFFRYTNWRKIDELIHIPRDKAYAEVFKPKWGQTWLVFDEDNDDHRWERVEMYYPDRDVYSTARWDRNGKDGGLDANPQSDTLGDRGEWDQDNSGGGKLYIGRWDHKIHLYGAEKGAWTVDEEAKYWGSSPVVGNSSPEKAKKVGEVVQYQDTDHNGFFDKITYDYDGDRKPDLVINLLDYRTDANPHPDVCPIIDPAQLQWEGMHELFCKVAQDSFQQAGRVYRALWRKGLTDSTLDELAIASSTWEQYDHGYWLLEKSFRKLDHLLSAQPALQQQMRMAYFTGDIDQMIRLIDNLDPSHAGAATAAGRTSTCAPMNFFFAQIVSFSRSRSSCSHARARQCARTMPSRIS